MDKNPRRFYVYVIFRMDGTPCYVGKGQGARWKIHEWYGDRHYNKHLARILRKSVDSPPIVLVRSDLSNAEACACEVALIGVIGRRDLETGPLCNLTGGGEGSVCRRVSDAVREKQSVLAKRRFLERPEIKRAISIAKTGQHQLPEVIARRRNTMHVVMAKPDYQIKHRKAVQAALAHPEYRDKMSDIMKSVWAAEGYRERMKTARAGKMTRSPEARAKLRTAQLGVSCPQRGRKGRIRSPEHRAALSAVKKRQIAGTVVA